MENKVFSHSEGSQCIAGVFLLFNGASVSLTFSGFFDNKHEKNNFTILNTVFFFNNIAHNWICPMKPNYMASFKLKPSVPLLPFSKYQIINFEKNSKLGWFQLKIPPKLAFIGQNQMFALFKKNSL